MLGARVAGFECVVWCLAALLWRPAVSSPPSLQRAATTDACFGAFNKNECWHGARSEYSFRDVGLDEEEFSLLCRALFRNGNEEEYEIEPQKLSEMFSVFDRNQDGSIDRKEFVFCCEKWLTTIIHPVNALIVVDVQNDFITGSMDIRQSPAQEDGAEVIDPINKLLDAVPFDAVFYSYDWHPKNHISFFDNLHLRELDPSSPVSLEDAKMYDTVIFKGPPPMEQTLWPSHAVQNSWGAELHKDLKVVIGSIPVYKGTDPDVDSYSAYGDIYNISHTVLLSELKKRDITDVYVSGLATDYCAGATAQDSLNNGFRTILLEDCCRGIDPDGIAKKKQTLVSLNGLLTDSPRVKNMVEGRDRRPELGYKLALELKNRV